MKKDLWNTTPLRDWNDFVSLIEKSKIYKDRLVWFFRGQADAGWELRPSLVRHFYDRGLNPAIALEIEKMVFINFRSTAHQYIKSKAMNFTSEKPRLASWMVMQHYRCPTRLLDWTLSPYVALYFAVDQMPNSDGAIWLFNAIELETLMTNRYGGIKTNTDAFFLPNAPDAIYPIWGDEQSLRSSAQHWLWTCLTLGVSGVI